MTRKIKGYGWRPDLPDKRDHYLTHAIDLATAEFPQIVDLRSQCPPVRDQGQLGSCTSFAISGAIEFDLKRETTTETDFEPSELFIYYNERVMEGTVSEDAGAEIRDGIKSIAAQGDCPEPIWPYDINKFTIKPSDIAYAQAIKHKALNYLRLYRSTSAAFNEKNIRYCIASLGTPVIFGFTVYESFESETVAKTGIVPMPSKDEAVIGGHAVVCIGYDANQRRFICRNSWGEGWGDKGYFYIPFDYLTSTDLADDFWIVRTIL